MKYLSEEEIIIECNKLLITLKKHHINGSIIQVLYDLYNKEKEQNRVNINSINDLMKECNEENKRCMELAIELDKEKEKNKDRYWKGYVQKQNESMEICKMCKYRKKVREHKKQLDLDYVDENYVRKDKIREKITECEEAMNKVKQFNPSTYAGIDTFIYAMAQKNILKSLLEEE